MLFQQSSLQNVYAQNYRPEIMQRLQETMLCAVSLTRNDIELENQEFRFLDVGIAYVSCANARDPDELTCYHWVNESASMFKSSHKKAVNFLAFFALTQSLTRPNRVSRTESPKLCRPQSYLTSSKKSSLPELVQNCSLVKTRAI